MRTMAKRLVVVLIAVLCSFCFLAGCKPKPEPGLNKVLAIGMETLPEKVKYEVGQYVDPTGGKVAVIYAEDPDEKVIIDLTEEMLNKNSYDINTVGKKLVVVDYVYEDKTYSTGFTVEYSEKPFRTNAIEEINKYKSSTAYSTNGSKIVSAYKSLATVNIKIASDEAEAKSIVANFKTKIDEVLTKEQEEILNNPTALVAQAQLKAIKTVEGYRASEVASFKENYAQMVEAIKKVAYAEINLARTISDIDVAVAKAQASVDNAALGNKTLDEINNVKIAAETAKKAAELAKNVAEAAKSSAQTKADEAKTKAQEASNAKTAAEKAQKAAEAAKAKAESLKEAAERAKAAAEQIKNDVNATKKQVNDALIASQKAQAEARLAEEAAVVAKNEAQAEANKAEAARLASEAAKLAAENAKNAAQTAETNAKAAKEAAENAAEQAKNYLEQIEAIYNALPVAESYINEVRNYVNNDDYSGIYKLLVVSLKDSYCAAIKASRSESEIQTIVAEAKAALDLAKTKDQIASGEEEDLLVAKASAKAEFKAYINMLEYQAPSTIDLTKYKNLTENPDQAALIAKIENLIANVEAKIDAATTTEEVKQALAEGQGKVYLETIYVDFYASCVVTELVEIFRTDYEPNKILYSDENYNKLLNIVKHYETYIGRIDKLDEIDEKFEEAKKKLEEVDTIAGEIAKLITSISDPIRLNIDVDDDNKAYYYPALESDLFDSKVKELDPIQVLLDRVYSLANPTVQAAVLFQLTNYTDPETGATRDLLVEYSDACDRYAKLVEANTSSTDGAQPIIDAINAIPAVDEIRLSTIGTVVSDARALWEVWVQKYFTGEGHVVLDADGNIDITKLETLNLKMITNYAKLVKAEERVEELKAAKAEAETPVSGIIAKIEAIDDEHGYIVLASEALITEVDQMITEWVEKYHINDINMELITNKATLETFRARVEVLKQAKEAAETEVTGEIAVIDAIIASIPEDPYITLAHKAAVDAARAEYNQWLIDYAIDETLEPINAEIVTNKALLEKYEERITQLENAKADAETASTGVIALIDAIPAYDPATPETNLLTLSNKAQVEDARAAYDAWINNYFTSKGYVAADEPTNTALVTNYEKLVAAEARIAQLEEAKAASTDVIALIDAIKAVHADEYVILDSEAAIIAAEEAYNEWAETYAIDPVNEYLVSNLAELRAARARLEELKNAKAAAETETTGTIALIDAIKAVHADEYVILDSETAINAANAAYEAWKTTYNIDETLEPLNADITSNREDLANAKARLEELKNAKVAAEDPTTGTIALINAIPQPVTLDDIDKINDALNAYNTWKLNYNIDEEQEPLNADITSNREVLYAAIDRYYNRLIPLKNETIAAIKAIGNISVNSGDLIAEAEAKYFELKAENARTGGAPEVDLNAHLNNGLTELQAARAEYEIALYVDKVEKSTHTVEEKYIELTALMGDYRSGADKNALFLATKTAKVDLAAVPAPTPDPTINEDNLGNWDRTNYTADCEMITKTALEELYRSAKYLVFGTEEEGYNVTIYSDGTYTNFITKEGADIKVVKNLTIDVLVGTGHVEYTEITVTGEVIVNGGGSSSVVFNKSVINKVVINKNGVRVAFDSETTISSIIAGNGTIDKVIIELNGQLPVIEANSSIEFRGTKGEGVLEILAKKNGIEITTVYKDIKIELEIESIFINGTEYDSRQVTIDSEGKANVTPIDIQLDDTKLCGEELTYVIDGTTLTYGGEGQLIPKTDGFKLGAKIVAPKNIKDFTTLTVTVNGEAYVPQLEGNAFNFVFDVEEIPATVTIEVKWNVESEAVTYVIKVLEGTKYDITAGTLTEGNVKAGDDAVVTVNETTITFSGTLKYYANNVEKPGHYVSVHVIPDSVAKADDFFRTYEVTEDLIRNGAEFTLTWLGTEFTYYVKFDENIKLEFPTEIVKIDAEFETVEAAIEGNKFTVSGVIPYFTEVEAIGRTEGHRIGIALTPKYLGLDLTEATITTVDGRTGNFYEEFVTTGNKLMYYPLIEKGTKEYTFSIKWNKYVEEQVYTIVIAEGTEFAVPEATSIAISAEYKETIKVFTTQDFTATILSKFADQEVEWTTSDAEIATINAEGKFEALKAGKVVVKATAKATPSLYDEVTIEVKNYTVKEAIEAELGTKVAIDAKAVATQYSGYWFGDETGLMLAYSPSTTPKMGEHLLIVGTTTTFKETDRYTVQLNKGNTWTELEGEAPKVNEASTPYELSDVVNQKVDTIEKAKATNMYGKIIKVKGLVKGSGNFWSIYDEAGNKFYISSSENTKSLVNNVTMELELIVREIYYKDDTSSYKNYKASELGGCVINTPKALAEGNGQLLVKPTCTEDELVIDELYYIKGINLFTTLKDALEAAHDGDVIILDEGTYEDGKVTISVNSTKFAGVEVTKSVTIKGPNAGINPVTEERTAEAIMNLSLRISADNVTIDGVQFVGDNVVAPGAVDGLTIVNCKVTNNKFDGFVRPENVIVEQTNVSFNNNLVEEHNGGRVIYLYCTNGLTVKGNSFAGALLCDAIRAQTYLAGTVVISDNKCTATTQSFIMVMGVKGIDALIENNYVEDIKSTIIDFRTMKEADAAAKFNIRYNTFKNSGKAWCPIRIRTAGYAAGNTIEVNVSDNKFIESYCVDGGKTYMFENPSYSSQTDPFKKIYTIGKNYYVIDGKVLTELTDELVDNAAISYDEPYATEEEVPTGAVKAWNVIADQSFEKVTSAPTGWKASFGGVYSATNYQSFRKAGQYVQLTQFEGQDEVKVTFNFYLNNFQTGTKSSKIKIEAFDANGTVVDTFLSEELNVEDNLDLKNAKDIVCELKGSVKITSIKVSFVKNGGGNIGFTNVKVEGR